MSKNKYGYICDVAWAHELGETDVTVYHRADLVPCAGDNFRDCEPIRVRITLDPEPESCGAV